MIDDIIKTVSIAAITGIATYLFNFLRSYVSRKKRLVYGLYTELLSNHQMLDGCVNFSKEVKRENIPRLKSDYYAESFSKSPWIRFLNGIKPLHIPHNITNKDLLKRFERLKSRPFVSSIHLLYSRIQVLNYTSIDSLQESRSFNKNFIYKSRANSIRHDLFILLYNLEKSFKYLGKYTV